MNRNISVAPIVRSLPTTDETLRGQAQALEVVSLKGPWRNRQVSVSFVRLDAVLSEDGMEKWLRTA